MATGYLNPTTKSIVPSINVPAGMEAAVKFKITNIGDNYTGHWTFSVNLPSDTDPHYTSAEQQNLAPGDRIEYVLGFEKSLSNNGSGTAVIIADPSNLIKELSKVNNIANALFAGSPSNTQSTSSTSTVVTNQ
jgi:hypothetical protein